MTHRLTLVAFVSLATALALSSSAWAAPPETRTRLPVGVGTTSATFRGILNEGAEAAVEPGAYEFLFKESTVETIAECESANVSKIPVPPGAYFGAPFEEVAQEATGLTPDTGYIVCVAAENGTGERSVAEPRLFFTLPETPETKPATEVGATSATLEGVLQPPGSSVEYEFEYNRGSSCTSGVATPRAQGDGAVSAVVTGLTAGTEYTFCLVALNAEGLQSFGAEVSFTTPLAPPVVDAEFVSNVGDREATLNATLNPDGLATTYHFEYGTTAAYGASAPIPDGQAGAGLIDVNVGILLQGLEPATTYHYRIVATNELGTTPSTDQMFSTRLRGSPTLLDGRGWELVSPANKRGALLEAIALEGGVVQAAADGGGLAYIARAPVDGNPAGNRSFAEQQLLATRGGGGWSTQDIATSHEAIAGLHSGELSEYRLFGPNLSTGIVEPTGATPLSPEAGERTPYLRAATGLFAPLVNPTNVPTGTKFGAGEEGGRLDPSTGVQFVTATPDLTHIELTSPQALTLGFEAGSGESLALYQWLGGALQPLSILPGGASASTEGGVTGERTQLQRNAVSTDGGRVFFRTKAEGRLFTRNVARDETVRLDAPEAGAEGGEEVSFFQGASQDGSKAFFTDRARLTIDSTARNEETELYECDLGASVDERSCGEKGALKDLTIAANSGEAADVIGAVLGYSADGEYVFFVANGVLSNSGVPVVGATRGDCFGEVQGRSHRELSERSCNLYEWHDGTTRLVASVSGDDAPDWAGRNTTDLGELTARVSPSGRFLAFMSQRSLTGYDNKDLVSGAADEEVFLYDATTAKLICASCDPTGARPVGVFDPTEEEAPPLLVDRPDIWGADWLAGSIPGWTSELKGIALYQSRYLSDEGRLLFNSPVGLVPADANGEQDVYEFEPDGTGNCTSSTVSGAATFVKEVAGRPVGGCIGLISSGEASEESAFLDAAATGPGGHGAEDVFFLTAAKLSAADVDDTLDVYDAHICAGASPCPSSATTVPPTCTNADSCRPSPEPQPGVFGPPASVTSPSGGNLAPVPVKAAPKPLTRSQKLRKALAACKKKANRKRHAACERQARKKYGAAKAKKRARKGRGRRS
jgi:hypothetical protein